jgi:hypothetical protein
MNGLHDTKIIIIYLAKARSAPHAQMIEIILISTIVIIVI